MIVGIGVDSVEIERVARKCEQGGAGPHPSRFMDKMFTPREIERSRRSSKQPYQHLAACFAAREAFFKATQVWYRRQQVSVAQYAWGEPYFQITPFIEQQLLERFSTVWSNPLRSLSQINVRLSLTHDDTYATAFAVCEVGLQFDVMQAKWDF